MKTLYLSETLSEHVACLVKDDHCIEAEAYVPEKSANVDAIYLGQVKRVDKSLNALFIDIGLPTAAYLDMKDLYNQVPTEGAFLLVQIIKAPFLGKGARVTEKINLKMNTAMVYLPLETGLFISNKIDQEKQTSIRDWFMLEDEGLLIRTKGATYSKEAAIALFEQLKTYWQEILLKRKQVKKPGCLFDQRIIGEALLMENSETLTHVLVDSQMLKQRIINRFPDVKERVFYKHDLIAQLAPKIEAFMVSLAQPVILLTKGIEIVVESTEAMTVIDVNSAGFTGKVNTHDSALKINEIAAKGALKAIEARNISGMIVIDFLRMPKKQMHDQIEKLMKMTLKSSDRTTQAYGFSRMGLFEMTRKRTDKSLSHHWFDLTTKQLTKKPSTVYYEFERLLIGFHDEAAIIEMHPDFYQGFINEIEQSSLKEKVKQEIILVENDAINAFNIKHAGSSALINQVIKEKQFKHIDIL